MTWIGHSSFLIQVGRFNVLADPHFSRRASPAQFAGPVRFVPAGLTVDQLPPIDAVVISHDHYDHLDAPSIRHLARRFGTRIRWFAPLGHARWLRGRGASDIAELDWWESGELGDDDALRVTALPARHWSSRLPWSRGKRLWASWTIASHSAGTVYFGGDSGYFPDYPEIGRRMGPFAVTLLPIGAYDPRWFMHAVHMNPEEAVTAWRDLGGTGAFGAMHWGTWRLTDEDPLEPPVRTRAAWLEAGLPPELLWIPRHGDTLVVPAYSTGSNQRSMP